MGKLKPKKLLRIPLKVIDQYVEAQTGIDLSKIFSTQKESGIAQDAELAVSMLDGYSAEILWDPDGSVSSSQMIAVVESIIADRPNVCKIEVRRPDTSSPQLVLPFDNDTDLSSGGVVSIQYEDINEEEDDATEFSSSE